MLAQGYRECLVWRKDLQSRVNAVLASSPKGTSFQEPSDLSTGRTRPAVGLRFEVGPGAAVHSPLAPKNGFLRLLLRDCDLELFTSVLNGLGPFLEDEEVPVVVPMQIDLLNSSITLKVRGLCSGSVFHLILQLGEPVKKGGLARSASVSVASRWVHGKSLRLGRKKALLVQCLLLFLRR